MRTSLQLLKIAKVSLTGPDHAQLLHPQVAVSITKAVLVRVTDDPSRADERPM